MTMSFKERIISTLQTFDQVRVPDHNNRIGRSLAVLYLWQEVVKYAKDQYETAMELVEASYALAPAPKDTTTIVLESPSFQLQHKVSKDAYRFNKEAMVGILIREFKCTQEYAERLVEQAKIPGNPSVTKSVVAKK